MKSLIIFLAICLSASGTDFDHNEFQELVEITKDGLIHCVGVLVSDKHIISSGFCFKEDPAETNYTAKIWASNSDHERIEVEKLEYMDEGTKESLVALTLKTAENKTQDFGVLDPEKKILNTTTPPTAVGFDNRHLVFATRSPDESGIQVKDDLYSFFASEAGCAGFRGGPLFYEDEEGNRYLKGIGQNNTQCCQNDKDFFHFYNLDENATYRAFVEKYIGSAND